MGIIGRKTNAEQRESHGPRKLWSWLGSFVLLATAACATSSQRAGTGEQPIEAAPPIVAPPPVVPAPEPGPPQHRVALLVPTTGGNARVGQSIANAANLALLDTNNRNIKLTVYNTATGAAAAAQRALADGAKIFLGPLLAPDVRAVQGIAGGAGVPILTFSNDAALAGNGTFVMGFQPDQSIARTVAFARAHGVERFAALVPVGTYGQRASNAFVRAVRDSGGRVVAIETFPRDRKKLLAAVRRVTDYEARVARASQGGVVRADGTVAPVQQRLGPVGFQALLIADSGAVSAAFLPALQQFGAGSGQVRLLGPELWNSEPAIAQVRGLHGAWFSSVPDSRFNQLVGRYSTKFGGRPSRLASLGYDAMLLVNSVADRWTIGSPFPRSVLTDPDGFNGIDGIFRFSSSGVAERGMEVQEVGPGGFKVVSPAPRSFGRAVASAIN